MTKFNSVPIESVACDTEKLKNIISQRKPVIFRNIDLGECKTNWSVKYLSDKLKNVDVKVHVGTTGVFSFLEKNFAYKTLSFPEFINRASSEVHQEFFFDKTEFYYLRSTGRDKRGKDVARIDDHFPEISDDLNLSRLVPQDDFFSSVLRISSKGVQIWTHYDVMDNFLVQVVGEKRVVLYPPWEADLMYLEGDKSKVLDIDCPDPVVFPDFFKATRHEGVIRPGDILFIPALWFHNTTALSYGVGVNIFWRHLPLPLYDKTDVYGNKDPLPAAKALSLVEKAVQQLKTLPNEYQDFYARRATESLKKLHISKTSDP